MARSKVKSRSHHDVAHLHLLTNVPTMYQLPTPYGFLDIARTRFYYATIAYHVGLDAVLGLPHPGPTS